MPGERGRSPAPPPPPEVVRFIARFDRGEYWLAHEELEELWQRDRRDLYKGLIQLAAAFVHAGRGNWNGARRLLERALRHMRADPDPVAWLRLEEVCAGAEAALSAVRRLQASGRGKSGAALRFLLAPSFSEEIPANAVADVELPYRVRRHDRND